MTLKEKIRICIEILFKGRDIKEELNGVERKRIELGERMKEQLELLINDEKPNMISSPDTSMRETIQIAEMEMGPVSYLRSHLKEPIRFLPKTQNFRLEIVDGKYRIQDHPLYIERVMDYTYQMATEELARELVRRKLVRVDTLTNPVDYNAKTLRFSVNIYKGF